MNGHTWPSNWMWASFVTAGLAIPLPWLFRRSRRFVAIACGFASVLTFEAYQGLVHRDVPPDTVVIQYELAVLLPLLALALVSCGAANYLGTFRFECKNNKKTIVVRLNRRKRHEVVRHVNFVLIVALCIAVLRHAGEMIFEMLIYPALFAVGFAAFVSGTAFLANRLFKGKAGRRDPPTNA